MKILYRAVMLAVALILIVFAVSNREVVSLALWPLPFLVDLPLYLLFFVSLLIGTLIGISAAWVTARRDRRELRYRRRRIDALESELAATQSQIAHQPQMQVAGLPADRQLI